MNQVDAELFHLGLSTTCMGAVVSQICLQSVHFGLFYVYSIIPHPTTPPIQQLFHLGLNTTCMGAVVSQICLQSVHFGLFYVYSIIPHPTTPPIWQIFQALLVYFDHMYIWKVSGCSNHGPFPFLMLWQPISEWYFWAWK